MPVDEAGRDGRYFVLWLWFGAVWMLSRRNKRRVEVGLEVVGLGRDEPHWLDCQPGWRGVR